MLHVRMCFAAGILHFSYTSLYQSKKMGVGEEKWRPKPLESNVQMTTLAIKLDPAKMLNPNADLRYLIPDHIQQLTANEVQSDGYDYLDDDAMVIFMRMPSPDSLPKVLAILHNETFCENDILETAIIGYDAGEGYIVMHPPGFQGAFIIGDDANHHGK